MGWIEGFLDRIKGARANIAVDDAQRSKGERCAGLLQVRLVWRFTVHGIGIHRCSSIFERMVRLLRAII
ncbi:hypothetical protein D9M72_542980 [compost metagenome]